jgi:hypothetical protein
MALALLFGAGFSCRVSSALGSGNTELSASAGRSQTGDNVAAPSTSATASPAPGTLHCNSAPADADAGTSVCSPSANTFGAEDGKLFCGVDFPVKVKDLRTGPWELIPPRSSSLEGEPYSPSGRPLSVPGERDPDQVTPYSDRIKTKVCGKTEQQHSFEERLPLGSGRIWSAKCGHFWKASTGKIILGHSFLLLSSFHYHCASAGSLRIMSMILVRSM